MAGKYLNNMPNKNTGGPGAVTSNGTTVPVGFDSWLGNGGGDYISPSFNTQNLSYGGLNIPDGMWHGTEDNYTTSVRSPNPPNPPVCSCVCNDGFISR
jgi:hypothetical protein